MAERVCRVCGCTDSYACVDPETGLACHWADTSRERGNVCSACELVLEHPVMSVHGGIGNREASCGCGWRFRMAMTAIVIGGDAQVRGIDADQICLKARDNAIRAHWMAVACRGNAR